MIPVLSVSEMRRIDEKAIGNNVAIGYSYMLRAGECLFDEVKRLAPYNSHGEIAVMCGKGNNGGDGFVAARLMLEAGYHVMCFGLCHPDKLQGEARMAFDQYSAGKGNFLLLDDSEDLCNLPKYTLIIDALLGTGLNGNPKGIFAEAIDAINQSGVPVLAVDTPSGLDNVRGVPGIPCIKAHTTVAMGFPKIGAFFYPGKTYVGDYRIKDLGYPDDIVDDTPPDVFLPTPEFLRSLLPARKPSGSKIDHGIVTMVCGSQGMTGSAALASSAAMRTGCGMVHLASPQSVIAVLSALLVEIVLHGITETDNGAPASGALGVILDLSKKSQSMCIGPGISHEEETGRLVRELVQAIEIPMVLDADGINAYKGRVSELKNRKSKLLITPHKGEWSRLFEALPENPVDVIKTLKDKAKEYGLTILYKGSPTLVADPQGKAYLLPFGNSGMATAGSGDVLSGIITSLAAQGCGLTEAAILGAYLHGEAGNAARNEFGEYSMIAGDMVKNIYKAIKTLTG
jgi:yjeF C-terminal region, hydroxyethylthiazole kinase-related/yjeF N-terminal region